MRLGDLDMAQKDYRVFEEALRKLKILPYPEYSKILDRLLLLIEQAEAIVAHSESYSEK